MGQESSLDINLSEGRISVAGSEDFVKHMFAELKPLLAATPASTKPPEAEAESKVSGKTTTTKKAAKKKSASKSYVPTIEFDLEGNGISLPKFWAEKQPPKNHQDQITAISYWLNKHGGIDGVTAGHLMYAYQELGLNKPGNPTAAITNTKARSKTVVAGPEPGTIRVNHAGENYVNSLPKSEE